jgi:hypothetical protein
MEELSLALWRLEHDPQVTRALYAAGIDQGQPCDCSSCRNFRSLGTDAFHPTVRTMLLALGIDPAQPAEIYQAGPSSDGRIQYGGFFHFIGRVLSGDREYLAEAESGFRYFVHEKAQLVATSFIGHPVVQLEFVVLMPWVLSEPCPD